MLSCRLFILAAALATAAAWPRPGEDELDDWFNPFFNCEVMKRQDIQELQSDLHTKLHRMKRDGWPKLSPEEQTVLVDTANKVKPVLVRAFTSTCTLVSSLNQTDMELLERVSNVLRNKMLEDKFRADLRHKLKMGDFYSIDILVEKLIQELGVVLQDPTVHLTESEKSNYISYVSQFLYIIRDGVNGLEPIYKSLTIQEVYNLQTGIQKIYGSQFRHLEFTEYFSNGFIRSH